MGTALQLLFTGLGIGSIYALVALGFVLIYRATNVVNFAQGDFAMLGAFSMTVLLINLGMPYWVSILITIAAMAVFGALFNLGVYYPLRNRSFLPVIISTIGASILLENGVLAAYGPQPQTLPGIFSAQGFSVGPVFFDTQYLMILAVTMVMVGFQYLLFERTLLGKKMQATSQDKEMASMLGIPVALMIMITFIYSSVLGGLAGDSGCAHPFRFGRHGLLHRAQSIRRQHHRWLRRRHWRGCRRLGAWRRRDLWRGLHLRALQGCFCVPRSACVSAVPTARHFRRKDCGESMSDRTSRTASNAPSATGKVFGAGVYIAVAAATIGFVTLTSFPAYTLNLLMQASTYAIAVLGLTIVLGYSGQINLAQAAFFGIGAYGVALGTTTFGLPFWVALADRNGRRLDGRRGARSHVFEAWRPLPCHGDDQFPDDSVAGADELG